MKLYSTHCPLCMGVENLLINKGISYEIEDDIDIVTKIANEHFIASMPFGEVDGKILDTQELRQWIVNQ